MLLDRRGRILVANDRARDTARQGDGLPEPERVFPGASLLVTAALSAPDARVAHPRLRTLAPGNQRVAIVSVV